MKKMSKKFLVLSLALSMIMALAMPMTAMALPPVEAAKIEVMYTPITIGATSPIIENSITYTVLDGGGNNITSHYTIDEKMWSSVDPEISKETSYEVPFAFDYGKEYYLELSFICDNGYQISTSADVTFNGKTGRARSTKKVASDVVFYEPYTDIESITGTIAKPEITQTIDQVTADVTVIPSDAIDGIGYVWYKKPAGADDSAYEMIFTLNEQVQVGYDYKVDIYFYADSYSGFRFTEDTVITISGQTAAVIQEDGEQAKITVDTSKIVEPTEPETTPGAETTAATTAAASTAASTSTKTGDTMNPMFYVITIIALAAAATVTIFAVRKKEK